MFSMFNLAVFDSILTFFESIANTLQYEYLLYVLLGIFVFYALLIFIKTRFSYEVRAIRGFKKINKYFLKKPFVNESNLVEFNKKMKKLPYQLRDRWQYFMLNREGLPSTYMTLYHCVEQPIKTSSYNSTVILASAISKIITVLAFALGLLVSTGDYLSITNLVSGALCALIFYTLSELYIMFLRGRFNILSIDLYEYFLVFTRNLDKASVSIPDYVDYELLFTNREIREGIPVLREYLEKKAVLEQAAIEKAKYNIEAREKFDFSKFGIDGSLVLERAMETSQDYINTRNRLKEEITKLEQEKERDNENYVNAEKEAQKKLQAIKENLDRMQLLMEESASRIEQNYIKKQQAEEVKKREQINKDIEDMRLKFAQETQFLDAEIKKRQDEIENGKSQVTESMNSEFETYSQKVYTLIKNKLEEDKSDELSVTKQELVKTKEIVERDEQQLQNKTVELELKDQQIETLKSENEKVINDLDKFSKTDRHGIRELYKQNSDMQSKINTLQSLLIAYKQKNNEVIYFDADGNFVNFEDYQDKKGYYKELPKVYDLDGNFIDFSLYYDNRGEVLPGVQNPPILGNFLPMQEVNNHEQENVVPQEVGEEPVAEEQAQDEEVVYYDADGNIVDFSQFYNEDGTFKEFPKVYDKDGNYYDFADYYDVYGNPLPESNEEVEEQPVEEVVPEVEEEPAEEIVEEIPTEMPTEEIIEEIPVEEPVVEESSAEESVVEEQPVEEISIAEEIPQEVVEEIEEEPKGVVYYDANGNIVDFEQFYNEDGTFKEFPKVYDKDGNYYDFADYYDIYGNPLTQKQKEESQPVEEPIPQEVVEDKPKRGRGRPRKEITETQISDKPKRGRGRPKKNSEEPAVHKRKISRVEENDEQPQEVEQKEQKIEAPKRGRGRPRKTEVESVKVKEPKKKTSKVKDSDKKDEKKKAKGASKKKVEKAKEVAPANKKKAEKKPVKSASKAEKSRKRKVVKNEEVDALDTLDSQIEQETKKLKRQQSELKSQISQTLSELQTTNTSESNLSELKEIVARLKNQASEAKKNGLSKEEQQKINKSLAELLRAMAQKK